MEWVDFLAAPRRGLSRQKPVGANAGRLVPLPSVVRCDSSRRSEVIQGSTPSSLLVAPPTESTE